MTEYDAMVAIAIFRSIVAGLAVVGAAWLAYNDKKGWGWMIFLAAILGSFTVKLGS